MHTQKRTHRTFATNESMMGKSQRKQYITHQKLHRKHTNQWKTIGITNRIWWKLYLKRRRRRRRRRHLSMGIHGNGKKRRTHTHRVLWCFHLELSAFVECWLLFAEWLGCRSFDGKFLQLRERAKPDNQWIYHFCNWLLNRHSKAKSPSKCSAFIVHTIGRFKYTKIPFQFLMRWLGEFGANVCVLICVFCLFHRRSYRSGLPLIPGACPFRPLHLVWLCLSQAHSPFYILNVIKLYEMMQILCALSSFCLNSSGCCCCCCFLLLICAHFVRSRA